MDSLLLLLRPISQDVVSQLVELSTGKQVLQWFSKAILREGSVLRHFFCNLLVMTNLQFYQLLPACIFASKSSWETWMT